MSDRPLREFNRLNDLVSIYRPEGSNTKIAPNSTSLTPGLIVLCSWVGAATKHIAKYTNGYKHLFPDASILLIQSTVFGMVSRADISPAYEIVHSFVENSVSESSTDDKNSMILHALSNGGANNAVWLATDFLEKHGHLPFDKTILDCCPGRAEISAISRGITLSLPNQYVIRTIGSYMIYFTTAWFMFTIRVLHIEDTISRIRRSLNDPELLARSTPRLYLYSKADTMVRFEDVHGHSEDARQAGYEVVREEVFEQAPHCALLNEGGKRYWDSVTTHILS